MRVLVVEDEQIMVTSICQILRECAFVKRIETARTGPEMIELCRRTPLDLILLDIVIPGFDGLAALAEVRRFNPDCPCVIITAHEDFAFAQRAIRLGVVDYLLKPIGRKTLLHALERVVSQPKPQVPAPAPPDEPPLLPPRRPLPVEGPVAAACAHLVEHCREHGLSLEEVAALVGLSASHLSRVFKEQTGENFVDYLTRLRVNAAAQLLRQTRASIGQVALAVGYADPNYLSRIFHRWTSLTPREYRESAADAAKKSASFPAKQARGDPGPPAN